MIDLFFKKLYELNLCRTVVRWTDVLDPHPGRLTGNRQPWLPLSFSVR